jgi:hypothetical protein
MDLNAIADVSVFRLFARLALYLAWRFCFRGRLCTRKGRVIPMLPRHHRKRSLIWRTGPNLPDFHKGNQTFDYKTLYTIPKDGFADGAFSTPEHHGTHVDAPAHFYERGAGRILNN